MMNIGDIRHNITQRGCVGVCVLRLFLRPIAVAQLQLVISHSPFGYYSMHVHVHVNVNVYSHTLPRIFFTFLIFLIIFYYKHLYFLFI